MECLDTISDLSIVTGIPTQDVQKWIVTLTVGIIHISQFMNAFPAVSPIQNSSIGLTSYQESFAVDPNIILHNSFKH